MDPRAGILRADAPDRRLVQWHLWDGGNLEMGGRELRVVNMYSQFANKRICVQALPSSGDVGDMAHFATQSKKRQRDEFDIHGNEKIS